MNKYDAIEQAYKNGYDEGYKNGYKDALKGTNSDTCVCCGEEVPEGRMVCPSCEHE